ncbi:MAG: helix-turn-helix domain-containing protein [Ruminococcaceae bacterium]|nr:helix-turn-helix domain-containing protein [Oscillospiraceae bacterium]
MTKTANAVMRMTRSALLSETPIRQDTVSDHIKYQSDIAPTLLYTHDIPEISVVVRGNGIHCIFNQAIPCKEGDIYIIASGTPHAYYSSDDSDKLIVRRMFFDPADWFEGNITVEKDENYCYGVFSDDAVSAYAMLTSESREQIFMFFDLIGKEISEMSYQWKDSVRSYLTLLLITVSRYVKSAIKSVHDIHQKDWGIVSATLKYVAEHFFDSELTLESLADELCVSSSHLSRSFKKISGQSFSGYLRATRLDHSCTLLADTELSISEIVEACGLRDVPSFYHNFHTYMGMTPHKYRILKNKNKKSTEQGEKIMILMSEISENLQKGKAKIVKQLVQEAIDEGTSAEQILEEGLIDGMNVVGEKFRKNEIFVPEVLVAARAMSQGAALLKPLLQQAGVQAVGKVCIGTVQGDLHDIGKNLVKMMLEGKGFEVVDLGTDVSPETFVNTAIEQNCQIICCSALLTTTMGVMADVVKAAEAAGIRDKVKIMIGGAPITQEYADKIGADAYTSDAAEAANVAYSFVS